MEESIISDISDSFPLIGIDMPDVWVWFKPTCPLRDPDAVNYGLGILRDNDAITGVRIVSEADARLHVTDGDGMLRPLLDSWPKERSKIRRTEVPQAYRPFNLEIFHHANWQKYGAGFMGERVQPVIEPKFTGLDIDDEQDYLLLKALIEARPEFLARYIHV